MTTIRLFETQEVRSVWDQDKETWFFSVVDVVAVLTSSTDAGAYWRKLKQRLRAEGNETVTNCHGLKMQAADGKMRLTDVVDTEQLLRLIQTIPSPKAEPFKQWLARVGYERIEETDDPELAFERAMETYLKKGYSKDWIIGAETCWHKQPPLKFLGKKCPLALKKTWRSPSKAEPLLGTPAKPLKPNLASQ